MLKKFLSVLSTAALLSSFAAIANAAEYIPPSLGDYYLNLSMTNSDFQNKFSGGGLTVDAVSGIIRRGSTVVYDATYDSVKLPGYMETELESPITDNGDYAIETMFMMTSTDFENDANRYDVMVKSNSGKTLYALNLHEGGEVSMLSEKVDGVIIEPMKWYTVKAMFSLPSGACEVGLYDENGTPVAEKTGEFSLEDINTPIRFSCTKGENVNPVYTKEWKFYKNNIGTAENLYPNAPSEESDYYFTNSLEKEPNGAAVEAGPEGNKINIAWSDNIESTLYTEDGASLSNGKYVSCKISGGVLDTSKTYVHEQDFKLDSLSETAAETSILALLGTNTSGAEGKEFKWIKVNDKTGQINNTNSVVKAGKWYTAKTVFTLSNVGNDGRYEVVISDKETGDIVYTNSAEHNLKTITQALRTVAKSDYHIKNYKFYQNTEVDITKFAPATFKQGESEIENIVPGTISITPKMAKTTEGSLDFTVLAVLYEKSDDGVLKVNNVQTKEYSLNGNTAVVWTSSDKIDVEVPDDGKEYVIKCFAWDGLDTVKPITGIAELN